MALQQKPALLQGRLSKMQCLVTLIVVPHSQVSHYTAMVIGTADSMPDCICKNQAKGHFAVLSLKETANRSSVQI